MAHVLRNTGRIPMAGLVFCFEIVRELSQKRARPSGEGEGTSRLFHGTVHTSSSSAYSINTFILSSTNT